VGLEPSIGKCYQSPTIALICSKLFEKTKINVLNEGICYQWKLVPYVNLGFVFGMKKGSDFRCDQEMNKNVFEERISELPGQFRDICHGLPGDVAKNFVKEIHDRRLDIQVSGFDDYTLGITAFPTDFCAANYGIKYQRLAAQKRTRSQSHLPGFQSLTQLDKVLYGEGDYPTLGEMTEIRGKVPSTYFSFVKTKMTDALADLRKIQRERRFE